MILPDWLAAALPDAIGGCLFLVVTTIAYRTGRHDQQKADQIVLDRLLGVVPDSDGAQRTTPPGSPGGDPARPGRPRPMPISRPGAPPPLTTVAGNAVVPEATADWEQRLLTRAAPLAAEAAPTVTPAEGEKLRALMRQDAAKAWSTLAQGGPHEFFVHAVTPETVDRLTFLFGRADRIPVTSPVWRFEPPVGDDGRLGPASQAVYDLDLAALDPAERDAFEANYQNGIPTGRAVLRNAFTGAYYVRAEGVAPDFAHPERFLPPELPEEGTAC